MGDAEDRRTEWSRGWLAAASTLVMIKCEGGVDELLGAIGADSIDALLEFDLEPQDYNRLLPYVEAFAARRKRMAT